MPRLTAKDYLAHRQPLIEEWFEHDAYAFDEVSFQGQHDFHDFYAPTEPFSDAEALAHRAAMTKVFPSLLQKAGRALQVLVAVRDRKVQRVVEARTSTTKSGAKRGLRIAAVVRARADLPLLAKAIVELAMRDTDGALLRNLQADKKRRSR